MEKVCRGHRELGQGSGRLEDLLQYDLGLVGFPLSTLVFAHGRARSTCRRFRVPAPCKMPMQPAITVLKI